MPDSEKIFGSEDCNEDVFHGLEEGVIGLKRWDSFQCEGDDREENEGDT
jgi:hypothetical protein